MVRPYLPASNDGHCVCVDVSRCLRIRNHPSDEWVYLHGNEKAAGAVYVLSCALFHLDTSNRIAAGFIRGPVKATSALATNGAVFWWQRSRFNASPLSPTRLLHGRQRSFVDPITGASLFTPMVRMDAAGRTHDVLS
jgi:hypothetical protein